MESVLQALSTLTPGFLFEDPRTVESPIYLVLLAVFAVVLIAGVLCTVLSNRLSHGNRLQRRLLDRYGKWAAWIGAIGIAVVGLRYTNVPLFSKRVWTFLDTLALMALAAHVIWYRLRRYSAEQIEYEEAERRRRSMPARRTAAPIRRPSRR